MSKNPDIALERMLNIADECIVTLPNFGFWKCRLDIILGKMPITKSLPLSWYETNNSHLCTIRDFERLCDDRGFLIKKESTLIIITNRTGYHPLDQTYMHLKEFI